MAAQKIKTTSVFLMPEFWLTVVTSVSGLLMAFGVITPAQADGVAKYAPNLIGAVLSLVATMKFVGTRHAAKVEVFRAMCAMSIDGGRQVSAMSAGGADEKVSKLALAAGL